MMNKKFEAPMGQRAHAGPQSCREPIERSLERLEAALSAGRNRTTCLRRWSEFIRTRDGGRCVACHETRNLAAHHIARKSFLKIATFQTGNGITLCRGCHREAHADFNGRPDLFLPADTQGGEKLALMERLYSLLLDDALSRGLLCDKFYNLSAELLQIFKRMQGHEETDFPGSPLEQAYLILAETELHVRDAILRANGLVPPDAPLLPGGAYFGFDSGDGTLSVQTVQFYQPRSG